MALYPVLVVDDEPDICDLVSMTLSRMQLDTENAYCLNDAKSLLEQRKFSLCLTDMRLPDGNGLELIEFIQKTCPQTPTAMITAHGNMDTAISALKAGAFDFLSKPIDLEQLRQLVQSAVSLSLNEESQSTSDLSGKLAGQSRAIEELKKIILRVARNQAPVFITGESGTGKEVVARLIHENSVRKNGPFIAVNCGAIPSELMESEFFGHKKGSFTGANEDKAGLFQAANGGTLLLDEVADLPMSMQVKLLRAIQEKAVRPVGGNKEEKMDVRILSATHKKVTELMQQEKFRNDLYYRINVIAVHIPSLRDRAEDIPVIAGNILSKISGSTDRQAPDISVGAMEKLRSYSFPGNVRELENILERAVALCESSVIEAGDLQLGSEETGLAPESLATGTMQGKEPGTNGGVSEQRDGPLDDFLEKIEKREIMSAMEATRWNKTEAAKRLGISFRSLRYRMKKLGLED